MLDKQGELSKILVFPLRDWVTVGYSPFAPLTCHPLFTLLCSSLCPGRLTEWTASSWLTCPLASYQVQPRGGTSNISEVERRVMLVNGVFNPMHLLPSFLASPLWPEVLRWLLFYVSGSPWSMITWLLPATLHPAPLSPFKPRDGNSFPFLLLSGCFIISCRQRCCFLSGLWPLNKSCKFSESQFPFM